MEQLVVGKAFPRPVPQSESVVMELAPSGELMVLMQFPGLSKNEVATFKKGFKRYWYWESTTTVPVAFFVFGFGAPVNEVEVNFDARVAEARHPGTVAKYMQTLDGQKQNALMFYLLDGKILRGMKMVGLQPKAVDMFHATLIRQLGTPYSTPEYMYTLQSLYAANSTDDFKRLGTMFKNEPGG